MAFGSTCEETEPDPVPQRRREGHRGDVALVVCRGGGRIGSDEMRAGVEPLQAVCGLDADQPRACGVDERRALCEHRADVVLVSGEQTPQPQIVRRGLAAQFPARGVAFFDAQHAEGFGAVGRHTQILARSEQCLDQCLAVLRGHGDFVGELAREREPVQTPPHAAQHAERSSRQIRKTAVRDVLSRVRYALQQQACPRACYRELCPVLGDGAELRVEFRPEHLMTELQVLPYGAGVRGGGGDEVALGRDARDGAVVHHDAVLAQHQRVARAAHGERVQAVGVDAFEQGECVRALHLDLAERGDIAHAHGVAHGGGFARYGFQPVCLAGLREVLRAQPFARFDEHRAAALRPGMRGREAGGAELAAAVRPGECAKCYGRVGRAERRGAGGCDAAPGGGREQRDTRDARGLALICRHAERGVAFQVLHRGETLLLCQVDVLGCDVVLEINKAAPARTGRDPQRLARAALRAAFRQWPFLCAEADVTRACEACGLTRGERLCQRERARRSARHAHIAGQGLGQEQPARVVETRTVPAVRGEMQRGHPAARYREQVAAQTRVATVCNHIHGAQHPATAGLRDHAPHMAHAGQCGHIAARVHHGFHHRACALQIRGRAPSIVVVGEDHGAFAGQHTEAVEVGAHRARQHHAGQVVVAENGCAFDGAARQHHALRRDAPQALAGLLRKRHREVVRDALHRTVDAVVEGAEHGGAGEYRHIWQRAQFGEHAVHPFSAGEAVDQILFRKAASARAEILVGQDHASTCSPRSERSHQTCSARTHHQHIAEAPALLVAVRVGLLAGAAQTCGAANRGLVEFFPERRRPHEGLVVEASAEERREPAVHCLHVEGKRGPAVLALRLQPLEELDHGGARVGFAPCALAQFHQRVGFFGAGAPEPARSVVFEGSAEEPHAAGEQRRGERVTRKAGTVLAVEAEPDRRVAIRQPAARQAIQLRAHGARSAGSRTSRQPWIRCVRVSRSTSSQLWQPPVWNHSSRKRPAGFSRRYT